MADFGDNADRVSKGRDDYVDTRQADVEGDDAEKLTLREKFLMGIEVVVPSDCSLYEALSALPTSGGNILVKEGSTHSWEGCVDLRCHDLVLIGEKTISAAQQRSGEAVIVRCPRVQGQLHFGDGSGTVEALEFSCNEASKGIEQVVSISGGVWTLTDCLVRCSSGSGREGDDNNRNHKGDGCNYRGFDVALHASGGEITLLGCRLGGFASNRLAYHSIYVSSRGKVIASGTTLCNCYGSAVEVRDFGKVRLEKCEIKRNLAAFSAGFPNQAVMSLDKNKIWENDSIWWAKKSRPMTLNDMNNSFDASGYSVSLFPDC